MAKCIVTMAEVIATTVSSRITSRNRKKLIMIRIRSSSDLCGFLQHLRDRAVLVLRERNGVFRGLLRNRPADLVRQVNPGEGARRRRRLLGVGGDHETLQRLALLPQNADDIDDVQAQSA